MAWLLKRVPTDKLEPAFLENAMYVDSTMARVVSGPGTDSFEAAATFDKSVVDGGVNGLASITAKLGRIIQPAQSGYLRNYAVGVAAGALALVAWFITRVSL
jgi:NADH-quinone oxidoreductase subunit L